MVARLLCEMWCQGWLGTSTGMRQGCSVFSNNDFNTGKHFQLCLQFDGMEEFLRGERKVLEETHELARNIEY